MQTTVLTDNDLQFTSKCFPALSVEQCVTMLKPTEYQRQTNGQVEQYKEASVSRLRHYVTKRQQDLDSCVTPLTYANNIQMRRSTELKTFSPVLSRNLLGSVFPQTTTIRPDVKKIDPPLGIQVRLINCATPPRRLADKTLNAA